MTATLAVTSGDPQGVSLDSAVQRARRFVANSGDTTALPSPAVEDTLAGEPALRFDYGLGAKCARQLVALHDGTLYALTLESSAPAPTRNLEALKRFQSSWRWDD